MSKMGKFLASKKGKTSVKASADTALQNILALEEPTEKQLLETTAVVAKITKVQNDEWGADDSEEETGQGGSVVVGGHLHLISEEDVSKKLNRKSPKKWGDFSKQVVSGEEEVRKEIVEEPEPVVSAPSLKYRPPRIVRTKIDVQNTELFPDFDCLSFKQPVQGGVNSKKKDKKLEERTKPKSEDAVTQSTSCNREEITLNELSGDDSAISLSRNNNLQETRPLVVIAVEDFFKGVAIPQISCGFDDERSRAKFIGRRKRPFISISASEMQGVA